MTKKRKSNDHDNLRSQESTGAWAGAAAATLEPARRPMEGDAVVVLRRALDEIEAAVRRGIDDRELRYGSDVERELQRLRDLFAERMYRMESRFVPPLPYDAEVAARTEERDEREAMQQQQYEAFLRENPGKAHFTREQWERAHFA